MTPELTADAEHAGLRLDAFLAVALPISRSRAQQLLESGRVRLLRTCPGDGADADAVLRKNSRVSPGQVYAVTLPEPEDLGLKAENIPLDIVYEDQDLLVINKPKGLVVHPAPGHPDGTLVNALMYHCGDSLSGIGGAFRPGIVHRLDMDTSGLMLAAKNDHAHAGLSAQLGDRSLSRVYEAILRGTPRETAGLVDAPIGRHPTDRQRMAVTEKNARPARTRYQLLETFPGYSYVQCELDTGRTHQIRVHMAYLGHPVAGDTVYGGGKGELGLTSQCLHARYIRFIHPGTGRPMSFSSQLPDYFQAVLDRLRAK